MVLEFGTSTQKQGATNSLRAQENSHPEADGCWQ
jgi:hypothetical protein